MRCMPMRYAPVRHTPLRFTPVRCTPVRYTPIRHLFMRCMLMNLGHITPSMWRPFRAKTRMTDSSVLASAKEAKRDKAQASPYLADRIDTT